MNLQIKKLADDATIPTRAHATDAGFDLYSPIGVNIGIGAKVTIPTGLSIALPENTVGLIYPRSSLGTKHDLILANTVGVIDSGYRGEILVVIRNQGDHVHKISAGDRIAQMIITPYLAPQIVEVTELPDSDRGERGFGSTGN